MSALLYWRLNVYYFIAKNFFYDFPAAHTQVRKNLCASRLQLMDVDIHAENDVP